VSEDLARAAHLVDGSELIHVRIEHLGCSHDVRFGYVEEFFERLDSKILS